jgi:hypothetical protein
LYQKCAKTHLRAYVIFKNFPGLYPRTPVNKGREGRKKKGREGGTGEGREGQGSKGREESGGREGGDRLKRTGRGKEGMDGPQYSSRVGAYDCGLHETNCGLMIECCSLPNIAKCFFNFKIQDVAAIMLKERICEYMTYRARLRYNEVSFD